MKPVGQLRISLVGYGNVGSHLLNLLGDNGIEVTHLLTRSDVTLENSGTFKTPSIIRDPSELPTDQLVLLCVNDDAIHTVLSKIDTSTPVAYTSGSVALNELPPRKDIGVFYPLQTFSKGKQLRTKEFPILIEGNNDPFESMLLDFGHAFSNHVKICNSLERAKIHEVAVWVNNFTNHIIYLAEKRSEDLNVDFSLLKPLLSETIMKLSNSSAYDAQTGPARRGDRQIIEKQQNSLKGIEAEIYKLLSKSIFNTYKKDEEL